MAMQQNEVLEIFQQVDVNNLGYVTFGKVFLDYYNFFNINFFVFLKNNSNRTLPKKQNLPICSVLVKKKNSRHVTVSAQQILIIKRSIKPKRKEY